MTSPTPTETWGDLTELFAASPTGFEVAGGLWFRAYSPDFNPMEDVDLDTDLHDAGSGWTNLGYISADGVQVKVDDNTSPIEVWSGDEIGQLRDKFGIEITAELYQFLSPKVQAAVWGADMVSTDVATSLHGKRMKVAITSAIPPRCTLLTESFYGDAFMRQIIPGAQRSGLEDLTLVHNKPLSLKPTWRTVRTPLGKHIIVHTDDGQVVSS